MISHKVLDAIIDNNLSWYHHIVYLCKVISVKVVQNKTIFQFSLLENFFHAHNQACLDYGPTVWDLACASTLKSLASLQTRTLKLILLKCTSLNDEDHKTLNILPLKLNKGIFMYKIMFHSASPYLHEQNNYHNSKN